jgi:sugar phosphate permease
VFYVHGIASILLFVIFAIVYRNSPKKHPCVGTIEMAKIAKDKSESAVSKQQLAHIPYASICKSLAVWSIWLAAVGNFCCVNMMFLYSPTYLNSVLGFKVNRTGLSAALPPLAQFLIKLIAGHTSDKIRSIDETNKLRIYNSIAFVGSAICLTTLAFTPTSWPKLCLVLLAMSTGVLGCTTGGFFKAPSLVSRHFSPFVTGNISLANTLTMLVVPFIVTGIAPNNTANEWRFVFVTIAAILVGTNLFFVIACSGAAARWTQITASNKIYPNSAVATTGGDLTIKSVV